MVFGMKNIFFVCVFVRCDFGMAARRIKLKLFITIFVYRFVITIIKCIVRVIVILVFWWW